MDKIKNYVLATAGLLILGGAVQFVRPLQADPPAKDVNVVNTSANPVPVVVQNGDADETMIITLAENLTSGPIEFDAVDVSGFRFVTFLAISGSRVELRFRFSTQAGKFSDAIPKTGISTCFLTIDQAAGCNQSTPLQLSRIAGPFLLVQILNTPEPVIDITLQVFRGYTEFS